MVHYLEHNILKKEKEGYQILFSSYHFAGFCVEMYREASFRKTKAEESRLHLHDRRFGAFKFGTWWILQDQAAYVMYAQFLVGVRVNLLFN